MGIVDVAALAASVAGVLIGVTMTAAPRRTKSAASAGRVSLRPILDRYILPIDVSGFVQALVKCRDVLRECRRSAASLPAVRASSAAKLHQRQPGR
jgi:hypothetical protein